MFCHWLSKMRELQRNRSATRIPTPPLVVGAAFDTLDFRRNRNSCLEPAFSFTKMHRESHRL
jgi:hypothetical protein